MKNKVWIYDPHTPKKTISDRAKVRVQSACDQFLEKYLRPRFVCPFSAKNKKEPQCIDIGWKQRGNFIYFKAIYKDMRRNAMLEEYDYPLARLEYMDTNLFNLAYFRHTGEWWTITHGRGNSLSECLDLIQKLPHFKVV